MSTLKGACLLGQSGGPTSVINASAAGVFLESLNQENITEIYAANHGILGILQEKFFDIRQEDVKELELLKTTPSSSIGSVRHKLKDINVDNSEYKQLLEIFKKYDIRYFFYNGGNDSMDTCNKISKFFRESGYECRVVGVPKTIDNDLDITDHTPGYASAAKYVATTLMEASFDARVYNNSTITVVEIMGRNAGWLAASAYLATYKGNGPDLIYLPERPFDLETFYKQVGALLEKQPHVLIAISEGIQNKEGVYIAELYNELNKDSFGHAQLGGAANILANKLKDKFKSKVRPIEFSILQRSAQHLASKVDVEEAYQSGVEAVKAAVAGETDIMIGVKRTFVKGQYVPEFIKIPLEKAANTEKVLPLEWIKEDNTGLTQEFVDYLLPLIQGDMKAPLEDGLPRFAKLKKIFVTKK